MYVKVMKKLKGGEKVKVAYLFIEMVVIDDIGVICLTKQE
jgi:hypothetical protein